MITPASLLCWIFCLWLVCCILSAVLEWVTVGMHCGAILLGGMAGSFVNFLRMELTLYSHGSVSGSCNQWAVEGALTGAFIGFVVISVMTSYNVWRNGETE